MKHVLNKLGWIPLPQNRTLMLCVPDVEAGTCAVRIVLKWREEQPRSSFVLIAGNRETAHWLSERLAEPVMSFPINTAPTSLLFLLLGRVRLIISLGNPFWIPRKLLTKAYDMGVPIIVGRCKLPEAGGALQPESRILRLIDWWEPVDTWTEQRLRQLGVPSDKTARPIPAHDGPTGETWIMLKQLAARRPPVRRPLQRLVVAAQERPFWQRIIERRARPINSLTEFRVMLGDPETILCLGNGPSSEDTHLDQYRHDALFRVNYRWIKRARFTNADVVFTGQKRTLFSVHPPIFGFQTRRAEAQLVTHHLFNPLCRPMSFVTLERLGILSGDDWDKMRPTNGAAMITAAVALEPRKLIIAGIDLFEDPAGAYPGDAVTPNSYVAVHDAKSELRFLLEVLSRYNGELIIVSDVLNAKWKAFKARSG